MSSCSKLSNEHFQDLDGHTFSQGQSLAQTMPVDYYVCMTMFLILEFDHRKGNRNMNTGPVLPLAVNGSHVVSLNM